MFKTHFTYSQMSLYCFYFSFDGNKNTNYQYHRNIEWWRARLIAFAPIGRNIARCEPEDNMFVHKRLFFFKVARKQILHLLFYEICEKQGKDQGKVWIQIRNFLSLNYEFNFAPNHFQKILSIEQLYLAVLIHYKQIFYRPLHLNKPVHGNCGNAEKEVLHQKK